MRSVWAILFGCVAFALGGCSATPKLPIATASAAADSTRTVIPVFFATDREPASPADAAQSPHAKPFSNRIHLNRANPLTFGKATGSIARTSASLGECDPGWWTRQPSAKKKLPRFPLSSVDISQSDGFYEALAAEVERVAHAPVPGCAGSTQLAQPGRRVLLYVHGFNDGFVEAAGNAAQLVYDLDMRAVPVTYSWPTQQSLLQYTRDETYAERAAPLVKQLVAGIIDRVKPDELHIVAHSMGARLMLQALQELSTERSTRFVPATSLVLYAPDIDTLVFERVYMPDLSRYARRVSVYANTHDIALSVSRRLNGGYALGDFDGVPFTGPGFHTIDVGPARQARLNHSGFETSPLITQQIQYDMIGVAPADRQCLCTVRPETAKARNPVGNAPFYRVSVGQGACRFTMPVYRAHQNTPRCAN